MDADQVREDWGEGKPVILTGVMTRLLLPVIVFLAFCIRRFHTKI